MVRSSTRGWRTGWASVGRWLAAVAATLWCCFRLLLGVGGSGFSTRNNGRVGRYNLQRHVVRRRHNPRPNPATLPQTNINRPRLRLHSNLPLQPLDLQPSTRSLSEGNAVLWIGGPCDIECVLPVNGLHEWGLVAGHVASVELASWVVRALDGSLSRHGEESVPQCLGLVKF
jgi:hypothetical protein